MEASASVIPASVSTEDTGRLLSTLRDLMRIDAPDEAARRVCAAVRDIVRADGATFVLRDGDEVYYAEEDAVAALWRGRRFPAAACISGWAVQNAETAVIEDIYDDPRIPAEAYRPTFVKSLCMTPASRERPLGAVGAYWARSYRATEREVWLLEQLADAAYGVVRRSIDDEPTATPTDSPLTRLLAVVAHDLRQPLSTIAQGAELLLEDADGRENAERREITERVARSAGHATELVRQVLDLTRLERDRVPLRVEDVALDALCEAVAADVDGDRARLRVELSPVRVQVDPGRLRQVVVNLLRNGLHHGDGARPVTLRVAQLDGHARVEVHNGGPAIPVERHAAIFEPFSAFDGGDAGTGTGLGLYIADQIVRAHGGELQLSSSDRDGTTFAVVLPLGAGTLDVA